MNQSPILERLVRVEILLKNHLKHHDMYLKFVLFPILIGVVLLVVEKVYSHVTLPGV